MAAQYLQIPVQLDSVQRQMSEDPNNVVKAGEKIGLQLRQLEITSWNDLRQLSFPALLQWNGARGEGLSRGENRQRGRGELPTTNYQFTPRHSPLLIGLLYIVSRVIA